MPLKEQLLQLLMSLLQLLFILLNPVVLIPVIIITIVLIKKNREYKNGAYYQVTKLPYSYVKQNKGKYGEYLTYKYLKNFETSGAKFLFNVYIEKKDGKTTEVDVLMICSKGIFVFESKNYSGWIFGSEGQKNWCQTLPIGRDRSHKEYFYNPIMQNQSHIKHLKEFLGAQVLMHSIIVFSDRCTLKNVQVKSNDVRVINRYNVAPVVANICNQIPTDLLSESDITNLYNKLYPYTQVDNIAKAQHIAHIQNNLNLSPQSEPDIAFDTHIGSDELSATGQPQIESVLSISTDTLEPIAETDEVQASKTQEPHSIELDYKEPQILKCPKCNSNLVLRTATRGINVSNRFYGCSNYPKCKYIQNIE